MRVLVVGSTGLIGSSVAARLRAEGHEVVGMARRAPRATGAQPTIVLDMTQARTPAVWLPHLAGIDAVVNCAGVLQDSASEDTGAVHADAAAALFLACEEAGIRKIVHFSAIGVDRAQPSAFSASKYAGDQTLMARDLDWVILRPSVVLGRPVYGAGALMRGLAALPVLPLMPGTGRLQVVQLTDVVDTVAALLRPGAPSRLVLELAGPEPLTMAEVIGRYRRWLGWPPARELRLPGWAAGLLYKLGDLAATLGWRPPMRSNAAKEIVRGAVGDPSAWTAATGIEPRSLAAALDAGPAAVQDRWFASLYFVKPAAFVVLPFFWIMTGIVSLTVGWRSGVDLMQSTGAGPLSAPAVVAGALADMVAGMLIAYRPTARRGLWLAVAISIFYAIVGTVLRPDLWAEPLGPLMKILPILVLHFAALAILEDR